MKQATIDDILQPGDSRTRQERARRVAGGFWRTVRRASRHIPFAFDIVPDFILGLGFTDDIAILTAAIANIRAHIKPEHRDSAQAALERFARTD